MARRGAKSTKRGLERETEAPVAAPESDPASRPSKWLQSPWPIVAGFVVLELIVIATGLPPWLIQRARDKGSELAKAGRYEEAIEPYEYLWRKFPQSPTVNLELGLVYLQAERWDDAINRLSFVASLPAIDAKVQSKIGLAHLGAGDPDTAMSKFVAALSEDSKDPVANFYLGERLFERGKYKDAAEALERSAFDSEYGERARARLKEIEEKILGGVQEGQP